MIKSISFIVLTHFFQFNQLKILRQPGYLFKLIQQYFLQCKRESRGVVCVRPEGNYSLLHLDLSTAFLNMLK